MKFRFVALSMSLLLSLGSFFQGQAQTLPELKERNTLLLRSIASSAQRKVLKNFARSFQDFSLEQIIPYFDSQHYNTQMKFYFEAGKKDTTDTQYLYLQETCGLSQEEEDFYLTGELINYNEFKAYHQVEYFYYYGKTEEENWDEFFFVIVAKDGQLYLGRFQMHLNSWKIFGAVG